MYALRSIGPTVPVLALMEESHARRPHLPGSIPGQPAAQLAHQDPLQVLRSGISTTYFPFFKKRRPDFELESFQDYSAELCGYEVDERDALKLIRKHLKAKELSYSVRKRLLPQFELGFSTASENAPAVMDKMSGVKEDELHVLRASWSIQPSGIASSSPLSRFNFCLVVAGSYLKRAKSHVGTRLETRTSPAGYAQESCFLGVICRRSQPVYESKTVERQVYKSLPFSRNEVKQIEDDVETRLEESVFRLEGIQQANKKARQMLE